MPASYNEQRAAQMARLDAYAEENPPAPPGRDAVAHPDDFHDPDDSAESFTTVGSWPPAPMGSTR